ncbi:MAG: electron transfer flavoprotein subunit alpha/FixB family protein [Oscillospiraceae bacterium]|nr:electron transfer flavoprotein subunit alpha/FixB family protein [Oscillospiraceae bacterium]
MEYLKIHHENITADIAHSLVGLCPFSSISYQGGTLSIDPGCRMCGVCVNDGPPGAITLENDAPDGGGEDALNMGAKHGEHEVLGVHREHWEHRENRDHEWRGIAVFAEYQRGRLHPVTMELIAKARELAGSGAPVYGVFIGGAEDAQVLDALLGSGSGGEDSGKGMGGGEGSGEGISGSRGICVGNSKGGNRGRGVDMLYTYCDPALEVFRIEPYANAFADFIEHARPSAVLVGATHIGRSLAPRVAARFRTGITADCTALEMRNGTELVQIRPAFGGNVMAQIVTPSHRPQFCTVRYKVFAAAAQDPDIGVTAASTKVPDVGVADAVASGTGATNADATVSAGVLRRMALAPEKLNSGIEILNVEDKPSYIDISEAKRVVAVGRGFKKKEDLALAEELARLFGAQIACTRPLIENGWFDPRRQIGLSGRTTGAELIITIGISGSVQFMAGMRGCKCIIAINEDPGAPIFGIAHYAAVGDLYDILPILIASCGGHQPAM